MLVVLPKDWEYYIYLSNSLLILLLRLVYLFLIDRLVFFQPLDVCFVLFEVTFYDTLQNHQPPTGH